MRVPLEWLHDYCAPELTAAALAERLDMTGTKVERVLRHDGADVLELEVTPNRPDCLGVYGVAREVHAATGGALAAPPWSEDPGSDGEVAGVAVEVRAPDLCPRFTARLFEDVKVGPSPPWLRERLVAAGQKPISNVVDITNYVMWLTGQPLHAFDFDRVGGGRLVVRRATVGERVETLDGEQRELDADVVVIDDADGPTSIAGLMGGARSEVSESTTRVLMEAATWNGANIHASSLRLGLRSEASARFEKQLQPESTLEAQAVAARLMVELCGARLAPGTIDVGGPGPAPATVRLRERRVAELLGEQIPRERQRAILESLGFGVADAEDGIDVTVPPHRRDDVTREADLIEEVARIDGMEKLPATLPARPDGGGALTPAQRLRRRAQDAVAATGAFEIAGWSFQAPDVAARLRLDADDPRRAVVRLMNPMSEDQSVMRTMLLPSLLDAARYNLAHGRSDLRLFESGVVYLDFDPQANRPAKERHHLGVLLTGQSQPPTWRNPQPSPADFYAAKGMLERLLDAVRLKWTVERASEPYLHPGRAAEIHLADGGGQLGWIGELHPLVAAAWDLDGGAAFEIDLGFTEAIAELVETYEDLTSFPAVRQDLAVVVADDVPAARVQEVVRSAGGDTLVRADVFDVYRGEQVGAGKVSLAIALEFRAPDRTLTDDEVAGRREAIAAALAGELGGELRA